VSKKVKEILGGKMEELTVIPLTVREFAFSKRNTYLWEIAEYG
jgi:predicted AAA+ superfamily ATPase